MSTSHKSDVSYCRAYLSDQLRYLYGKDKEAASRLKITYHRANILPLVQGCPLNAPVLEIGPGFGEMIAILKQEGFTNISALDNSPEVVDYIKKTFGIEVFCRSDTKAFFSEKTNYYHRVILCDVLEHFPKEEVIPILQSVRQSLVPGGAVIIQTVNASSPFSENSLYLDFTHQWAFTESSMHEILRMARFDEIRISGYKFPKGLIGAIRTIFRWPLHCLYYLGAVLNGIVRINILDPNLVAMGIKKNP